MVRQAVPEDAKRGIWKPKVGDKIEGEAMRFEDGKYGAEMVIKTPNEGEMKLPAHKVLQNKLGKVKVGNYVWIECSGKEGNKKGNDTILYKVDFDPEYVHQAKLKDDFPQAAETMPQKTARFLTGLGTIGVHDSRIIDTMISIYESAQQAHEVFRSLKASGQITQKADGCWIRT